MSKIKTKSISTDINELIVENGCIKNIHFECSSHYNERPQNIIIDLLVIHCASLPEGQYDNDNLESLFCGNLSCEKLKGLDLPADLRVSTHIYIKRNGEVIQFVPFDKRAWHAGVSIHNGRVDCNDFSIGIELQGSVKSAFTSEQYKSLRLVTRAVMEAYPAITKENIVGHSDIAPDRKFDPGEYFAWEEYLGSL